VKDRKTQAFRQLSRTKPKAAAPAHAVMAARDAATHAFQAKAHTIPRRDPLDPAASSTE